MFMTFRLLTPKLCSRPKNCDRQVLATPRARIAPRLSGFGFRVQGLGFSGLGFRV